MEGRGTALSGEVKLVFRIFSGGGVDVNSLTPYNEE